MQKTIKQQNTRKPLLTKSYKMVWPSASTPDGLSHAFNIKDLKEYTPGRQFVAESKYNFNHFGIQAPTPVFHYCDNAVDTLMWYWEVFNFFDDLEPTIHFFEIQPHGKIYKNRAPDETMLWQCGCNKIEIIKEISMQQLMTDAYKEIQQKQEEIITRYPHYDMVAYCQQIKKQAIK